MIVNEDEILSVDNHPVFFRHFREVVVRVDALEIRMEHESLVFVAASGHDGHAQQIVVPAAICDG